MHYGTLDTGESFVCPRGLNQKSNLVSVVEYYMNYSIVGNQLLASYPGVQDAYNTSHYCLVYVRVCSLEFTVHK